MVRLVLDARFVGRQTPGRLQEYLVLNWKEVVAPWFERLKLPVGKLVAADGRSVGRPQKRSLFLRGRSDSDESNP